MKLKEKFDSIDQSKLNADQKDFLSKIEKATKNFTSDNKEVNDKVEGALDKMIATFKEKMPEAIKTKAEKKEPKTSAKKSTAKPSQTSSQKRTVMSVAKEIRKDGESWADAQKRARAEMKKDKDSATKEVKTEMDKLLAFIKNRKELEGIHGTDLKRDSSREAKPRGRRISKDGNVYYENRENRIDRLAPNYPKDAPMLAGGGDVGKKLYYERMNVGKAKYTVNYHDGVKTHKDGSAFYDIAIFKNKKDLQDFISKLSKEGYKERSSFYEKGGMLSPRERYNLEIKGMTGVSVGAIEKYIDENNLNDNDVLNIVVGLGRKQLKGTDVSTAMIGKKGNAESKKLIEFVKDNKAMKLELGGTIVTDLAGHTGGSFGGDPTLLSGVSGTSYSGLVGETGAMSSGEMFENGGSVGGYDLAGHLGGNFNVGQNDGALSGVSGTSYSGLVGETGAMSSGEMFMNGGGVEKNDDDDDCDYKYRKGGALKNDRRHVNYSQDYEVRYSKNNPNKKRHGYGGMKFNDGGYLTDPTFGQFQAQVYAEGGSLENHGIKEGDTFVKTIAGGIQKVKDKDGKIVFINLATGERDSQPPLPFDDGGEVTYFVNKDGIKVRSVAKPDKELSEKEWMEKHSESKEARAYKYGGNLEINIKSRLAKNFNLPLEVAVYVPSTKDADEAISEEEFESRVESVQKYLSDLFGGFSSNDVDGGYMSQEKGLITEEVYKVISFAKKDDFSSKMEKLVAQIKKWAKDWGQESIGLEFEGDLFYIDQKGNYAEGGELNAFSMRMVKGTNSKPDEVLTENREVKFAGGGKVEKRQAYLDTLADKESDIWDKLGAESGGEIRQDKDMLRNYALKMEAMLKREEVGKGSFDEADYDHFQDMNAHLMNEFLVWNNYYEPEMTVREKKWRTEKFPDSKYRNYVSDPKVISLSDSNTDKADKYIVHADIKFVTVEKNGKELKFKGSDVLNGANILKNGGELSELTTYYPKRSIVSVELKDGKKIKPSNGYWVKKNASEIKVEKEYKVQSNVGIFPKKGTQTYWYVENSKGQTINRHTDKPYRGKEMDNYIFYTERNAESFAQRLNMSSSFENGGKVSFAEKSKAIAKNFEGKRVEPEYQKEYGKTYDAKEAKEVGDKIAGAQKAKYDAKAEKGAVVKKKVGNPNAGQAMLLAKKIRKDGEKWTDAVKRANVMIKNK